MAGRKKQRFPEELNIERNPYALPDEPVGRGEIRVKTAVGPNQ
jgi:hypothetical protein